MKTASIIEQRFAESAHAKIASAHGCAEAIEVAAELVVASLHNGGKVLLCGNGGSAADCQHIASELVGRFLASREGLPAVALTTDTSVLTSVGNDFGFEEIFSRQVEALGQAGDVLIGLSTSAASRNVIEAMVRARELGLSTVALVGMNEGPLAAEADVVIRVPSSDTPRIQEVHITIGHIICELVEHSIPSDSVGRGLRVESTGVKSTLQGKL